MTRVFGINELIGFIMFIGIKIFIGVFILRLICGDENDTCL